KVPSIERRPGRRASQGAGGVKPSPSQLSFGKETGIFVLDFRGRSQAVLAALALLVSLAGASCKLGGNSGLNEANKLNQSAGEDISEIEKIIQQNKEKE